MKNKIIVAVKSILVILWTAVAFFILLLSPSPEYFRFKLVAFRYLYIPLFYWIWVAFGVLINAFLYREKINDTLKIFLPVSLIFHLLVLMLQLIMNKTLYLRIDEPYYIIYIYAVIYIFIFVSLLWSTGPLTYSNPNLFLLRAPLILAPFLCLSYSIYKESKPGMAIFALSIASFLVIAFLDKILNLRRIFYNSLSFINRNKKLLVWIVFLAAFAARAAFSFIVITSTGENYIRASDDGISYDGTAMAIAETPKDIIKILVKQPWPGVYMTFLSILYMLFGRNFYVVGFFQSLLGASVAVLVYYIAKNIFNQKTGAICGFLIALSQPLIFSSAVLGTEAVYIPLLALAVFLFIEGLFYSQKRLYLKMSFSGIIFAIAAMTLGSITLFPILAFIFILANRHKEFDRLRKRKIAYVFFISFLVMFFSIKSIYILETGNIKQEHDEGGHSSWVSESRYGYSEDPDNRKLIKLHINPFRKPIVSLKNVLVNWREVLSIGLEIYPIRLRNFFLWGNFGNYDPIFLANPTRVPTKFASNLELYTLIFFFIGLFFSFKRNKGPVIFILLLIGYYAFIHAIIFPVHSVRYSCPIKPFLILFLSYGLYMGFEYFRDLRSKTLP